MRWNKPKIPKTDYEHWNLHFVLWPIRLDDQTVVWWEWIDRRLVVDDEGNWAGGYRAHWEYRNHVVNDRA